MAVDPVCKMNVDEKKAAATYEYKGKTYYFCAVGCKESFSKNPEKYLGKQVGGTEVIHLSCRQSIFYRKKEGSTCPVK